MNKNINPAKRILHLDATIHTIEVADLDATHKSKGPEARIETKAKLYTTKTIVVNEVKSIKGIGNSDTIIVNGGGDKGMTIPANQEFISESGRYNPGVSEKDKEAFFADYDVVTDIVNAANQGEYNRLAAIQKDIADQMEALENVIDANNAKRELYRLED